MFKVGGGGSTAKPLPRIKAARKLIRQKQKLRENKL
jgi:hypothetical protein